MADISDTIVDKQAIIEEFAQKEPKKRHSQKKNKRFLSQRQKEINRKQQRGVSSSEKRPAQSHFHKFLSF